MMYRAEYRLLSSDVDLHRRLRLSRLFTMLQEAAIAHTERLGMGRERTLDRGILWAVAMQRVRIHRLPEYDERVTLESWPGEMMHVLFPRYSRLLDESGETLMDASALWILMDARTRARVFPEQAGVSLPGMGADGIPLPRAVKAAGGEEAPFTVPYSYCDLNGHMNNARLPDIAEDLMPPELRDGAIRQVEAEYLGEARPGEQIALRTGMDGRAFTLAGSREGRPLFKLRMEYESGEIQ